MKTFNLSQSYPTQDIRKHTSFLTISLSACLLAAGLILLFLPEINSQSNIDILRMVAGRSYGLHRSLSSGFFELAT